SGHRKGRAGCVRGDGRARGDPRRAAHRRRQADRGGRGRRRRGLDPRRDRRRSEPGPGRAARRMAARRAPARLAPPGGLPDERRRSDDLRRAPPEVLAELLRRGGTRGPARVRPRNRGRRLARACRARLAGAEEDLRRAHPRRVDRVLPRARHRGRARQHRRRPRPRPALHRARQHLPARHRARGTGAHGLARAGGGGDLRTGAGPGPRGRHRGGAGRTRTLPFSRHLRSGRLMNINDLVRYWGRNRPDHDAIIFGDTAVTWRELDAISDALARGLAKRGVRHGDRVGILMTNKPEVAALMLATVKLGAICAPLNFRLKGNELATLIEDADPKVVVADGDLVGLLEEAGRSREFEIFALGGEDLPPYSDLLVEDGPVPVADVAGDDPAFICYTSGTTGVQKGALLTHAGILSVGQSACLAHGL